jgi:methylated-DNA-[protein]-cysteine S-methyltransferase
MMSIRHTVIDSPLGPLTLVAAGDQLTGLYFRHHHRRPGASTLGDHVASESNAQLQQAAAQLSEYFIDQRRDFDLPLSLVGSDQQRRVWELLADIGYGDTRTYGDLAAQLDDGTTAYEIGQIVGRNPLSIIVPCHRVVGKDGALTGYAGGLARKRFLLGLEEPAPGRSAVLTISHLRRDRSRQHNRWLL